MGVIILGANTLYIIFCLFKQIPMVSKGLIVEQGLDILSPFFSGVIAGIDYTAARGTGRKSIAK